MLEKLKEKLQTKVAKVSIMATGVMATLTTSAFAETTPTNGLSEGFKVITDNLTKSVSVGDIALLVGGIVGSCVVFVLFWMGARKGLKALMGAIKGGSVKI